jgi:hypothetical protein
MVWVSEFQLAGEFLPTYGVADAVATVAGADREGVLSGLVGVDLLEPWREAPLVGPDRFMVHLAVKEIAERASPVTYTERVSTRTAVWLLATER